MSDFLATMHGASLERLEAARRECDEAAMRAAALATPPPLPLRRHPSGFDLIAEIKLRSPAAGELAPADLQSIAARAHAYAADGAAAVSVLTEPSRFGGSLEHLRVAAAAIAARGVPTMRKDFLAAPYQVYEARRAGAGGVLLILRMLDDDTLHAMLRAAEECELFVLLEAFDAADLERGAAVLPAVAGRAPLLLGLNTRNLHTLEVDAGRLEALAGAFPPGAVSVAESGLGSAAEVARAAALGYDFGLVGTALMHSSMAGRVMNRMLRAGRDARAKRPAAAG